MALRPLTLAFALALAFPPAIAADLTVSNDKARGSVAQAASQAAESMAGAVTSPLSFLRISYSLGDGPAASANADSADLWERIRDGLSLDELDSPLVDEHVRWYARRPDYVKRMVDRSRRYLFHIVEEVQKRAMPMEVALLPMVESAFNPMAYSRSHASGIWQFIPSTGRLFGLKQNTWYDGRRDILAATNAALDYLQNLYNQFGSWELALAAYNCGEGCVQHAIDRNKAKGLPTDYESLRLPTETRHYVPKLMAVRAIVTHPDEYGLDIGTIPNQPYFAQVKLKDPIDVKLAARLANVPVDEFLSLNPAYSRKIVRSDTPRPVLLPVEKADLFAANLENYDQPLVSWDTYSGHRGEKLSAIAAKYRVTVGWILEHNNLKVGHGRLTRAQTLVVPASSLSDASWKRVREHQVETASSDATATRSPDASTPAGEDRANEVSHVVAKGDTISRIARRYGVTPQDIRNWNSLESDSLSIGQSLTLRTSGTSPDSATKDPEPARKATKPTRSSQRHYTVRRGDSLYSIAKRFDIGVERIKRANHLVNHRRLAVGKKLVIPTSNDS